MNPQDPLRGVTIQLLLGRWREVDGMRRVRWEVGDTGQGVEPWMREGVFEGGVQAGGWSRRGCGGTGVGMAR